MNKNDQTTDETEITEGSSDVVSVKAQTTHARASQLYANELANLFAGLMTVAIALLFLLLLSFAFGFWPGGGFPVYLITAVIVLGGAAFVLMMFFIGKAEEHEQHEESASAYVINKWRISTMNTTGMPEDIITGLKSILPEKRTPEEVPELVMRRPFEFDAWIYRLSDLLGEDRVFKYEDQLLRHTRIRINE